MTRQTTTTGRYGYVGGTFTMVLLTLASLLTPPTAAQEKQQPLVVICVRHAEKVDTSKDPDLSAAGKKRAQVLDQTIRNASLNHVHSSDFIRTRKTAAPAAKRHGVKIQLYNPRDLPKLVKKIRKQGGRHLVVGHSNTTPALVKLLGGEPSTEIDEPREYDRLYIVTIGADGHAQSVLLRFGKLYRAAAK